MRSKRLVYWALAIPAILILLIVLIVKLDTAGRGVPRSAASKAMALALAPREACEASQKEHGSHFAAADQGEWYAKYIDYLLERGVLVLEDKEGVPDRDYAADALTYGEAAYAAEQIQEGLSGALNISTKKYDRAMPLSEWELFYPSFLEAADQAGEVRRETLLLYGTPDNVPEAAAWTAYTDQGILNFEGVALDACIDREIEVYRRGSEIISLIGVVSDQVTYRNVWTVPEEDGIRAYLGSISRTFPGIRELSEETGGVLADLELSEGKIKKVSLKKDTIEGKVLSVREDAIEIEGYGTLKLDPDFRVYKTYGVIREQKKESILVGYDLGRFVVAKNRVCAALQTRGFAAQNIRVLIMDSAFSTIFHEEVALTSQSDLIVRSGANQEKEEIVEAGKTLRISAGDGRLETGRLTVSAADAGKEITVLNVERGQGTPSYFGTMEISREEDGLLLVNEVDVEDYLTRVVPSEMPASYELEALKAQAVCARTYAWRQIQANAYSRYGAHVDDSTNYQVYNNTEAAERTDLAVKETDGQLVFYGEEPAQTYYFSTSCGHSTDGTVWGASLSEVPYLKGISLSGGGQMEELTENEAFEAFIRGQGEPNYDSGYPLYRWQTTVTNRRLEEKIDSIGEIQGIFVTERGTGGIAKRVQIVGSGGTRELEGQTQIRNVLGSEALVYERNDGSEMTGWASLPSAFIAVDETARSEDGSVRTFTIWGGGYGHGVGMSQNGAQEMARRGMGYREILEFFYDGVEIRGMEAEQSAG